MRVHELAKELGVSSKDIIAEIQKIGGQVKGHMSLVEDAWLPKIQAALKTSSAAAVETPKAESIPKKAEIKSQKSAESVPVVPVKKEVSAPASQQPKQEVPVKPVAPKVSESVLPAKPQTSAIPTKAEPVPAAPKEIKVRLPITVGNLAAIANISIPTMIKSLMAMGIFANVNQLLNEEIVKNLAEVLNLSIVKEEDVVEALLKGNAAQEDTSKLKLRPPVVTMMGHVDHGKTSLLDAIRKTNVASLEKGAITQHIGAYGVDIPGKGHVTFLDTPGHEAFSAMRARGANVTDIVVLVVAADDGIMPQTIEAIHHAREAGCPIVVAINKVDLPQANIQKVMGELQSHDLQPEAWGGKTICVEVSAKTGKGIPEILEMLLLEAEVLDLKANFESEAAGTVIEAHLSKGTGPISTVIVQRGTLKVGDIVVCGEHFGRVRGLRNDRAKHVQEAGPSYAVSVLGISGVPEAGDTFYVAADEKTARRITEQRALEKREHQLNRASKHLSLENLYQKISEGDFKELKIITKADVQGSMGALTESLEKLSNDQCQVRVIHAAIGAINESDVMLAAASDAVIIGFHVRADSKAEQIAEKEGVSLRYYNIIYEAIEEVHKAMEGLLEPTYTEVIEGKIEIRKVFQSSKVGSIGGGYVIKGKVARSHKARLIRNNVILFDGKLSSLKRFKDDVRDVSQGYECGLAMDGFNDLKEGDIVESYRLEKVATKLG